MSHTIGLVADSAFVLMQLRTLVTDLGQSVTYTLTPDQALESRPLRPSLWLVVSEDAADVFEALSEWSDSPIFLADDMPSEENSFFNVWRKNLSDKLCKTLDITPLVKGEVKVKIDPDAFRDVWVIAASLGGPEAVKVFLANINPELPVTFVYAQHIEPNFDQWLPDVLAKESKFDIQLAKQGLVLCKGKVVLFPSNTLTQLDAGGRLHVIPDKEWQKPYTPNINQIIDNVADFYREKMGVIVFSGMCDDGASSAITLKKQGVPLWAQQPDECICSAMPEAVIDSGLVDYIGTAEALAKQLNQRYFK